MLRRSTIQLLRFHFSLFLMPVYLFALSQVADINWQKATLVFVILHLLVYPASNGYNSYMDRDQTPIGGLQHPMQPTRQLFYVSVAMDAVAVLLSVWLSPLFALGIFIYILASRAYSYRGIRLKRFPVVGFLTVFIFQGAWIYLFTYQVLQKDSPLSTFWLPALISSLLIGALYPLTQIYQHEEDKKDGVVTISYLLGKRGSFVFSMLLFVSATAALYFLFNGQNKANAFQLYLFFTGPVVLFFLYWMQKVWRRSEAADFSHSLKMNLLATLCTAAYFITLIIINH